MKNLTIKFPDDVTVHRVDVMLQRGNTSHFFRIVPFEHIEDVPYSHTIKKFTGIRNYNPESNEFTISIIEDAL